MKLLHQDVLLSLVKKNKIISLLSFSAYISFQLSCFFVRFELERDEKRQGVFTDVRVCEIKMLELKVCFFL